MRSLRRCLLHVLLLWPAALRPPASEARRAAGHGARAPATAGSQNRAGRYLRAVSPAPTPAPVLSPPCGPTASFESTARFRFLAPPAADHGTPGDGGPGGITARRSRDPATGGRQHRGGSLTANATSAETLDGLRGYRLPIASQARRFKRYPAEAKASGWAGSTEVRLEVGADGSRGRRRWRAPAATTRWIARRWR
jgi:outer membrane biosynthesis protein TonB